MRENSLLKIIKQKWIIILGLIILALIVSMLIFKKTAKEKPFISTQEPPEQYSFPIEDMVTYKHSGLAKLDTSNMEIYDNSLTSYFPEKAMKQLPFSYEFKLPTLENYKGTKSSMDIILDFNVDKNFITEENIHTIDLTHYSYLNTPYEKVPVRISYKFENSAVAYDPFKNKQENYDSGKFSHIFLFEMNNGKEGYASFRKSREGLYYGLEFTTHLNDNWVVDVGMQFGERASNGDYIFMGNYVRKLQIKEEEMKRLLMQFVEASF